MKIRFSKLAQFEVDDAIEPGLRRCLLTRFPYGIIYGIDSDTIIVIAVAHLHRKPRYWIDRLSDEIKG